ncbi:lysophospholipid acyltransferase family protein [Thiomicrorhabdus lithotrophica]|uniref:Lysophospholipid acyltransferase family protein n=1 Tax=Thiomicrorhabdus lithotrophica TaxID=2949997 RepID=A0ABY8CEF7_9GAMM|nr:lysophospholipid acyltransferase family protein [Thiomicrorhabdus lithotrophica]WEJ62896.1 lysophospholipid acyltransferase family protein [Thiomicrorhabdus lithotrophica]
MRAESKKTMNDQAWLGSVLKGLIVLFSWMPLRLNQMLGSAIGHLLYWIPNSNRRVAKINLQQVYPNLSAKEQSTLLKANLIETAKATTELGPVWCWDSDKLLSLIKEVQGQALIEEAINKGKGVIFLAPHQGSWELIGTYLSALYPSTFLYRPPNVPSIEKFMVSSRGRFGAKLAPTDARGVRQLMKALKSNEVTAILPDQDPGASGGIYAPFFNRPARTMTLVSKLVQKTDCVCLFVVMQRIPKAQGYVLHVMPADEKVASENVDEATEALNVGVEACIAIAPEQYLWSYKRYRKPPPGVKDIYKKAR